jgi:capsular exopolysaccharide synthesis family protein
MKKKKRDSSYGMSIAHARESFGKIKVNLQFLSVDNHYKCILFSSSVAGEGKSTVAANLAVSLAASEHKTLLIDADLRHPTQHRLFNVVNKVGLSDIIVNNLDWKTYVNETDVPNLFVISTGRIPPNPAELLGSNRMGDILAEIRHEYDFVLIDSSPVLLVPDPISLSKHVDGVVIVARYNFTTQPALISTRDALKLANRPIIGTILNNVSCSDRRYEYGKKYGYKHGYYRDYLQPSVEKRTSV